MLYAVRCFDGDSAFDDFDGNLINVDYNIENIFVDLFNALVEIDSNHMCEVMDFEFYAIGRPFRMKTAELTHTVNNRMGQLEDKIRTRPPGRQGGANHKNCKKY